MKACTHKKTVIIPLMPNAYRWVKKCEKCGDYLK